MERMVSSAAVQRSFDRSFGLYRDLVAVLGEGGLQSRLPGLRSNTAGAQMWCVVGARESYARAIAAGEWEGFSCSLDEPGDPARVEAALRSSEAAVSEALRRLPDMTEAQDRLVLDLLEHEAQHHGQLIRFLYALRLEIPASWRTRYALD
jgi:hypothetical protein